MSKPGSRGSPSQAADGCKLDSRWERIVHDTIAGAGLVHQTHPSLDDGKGSAADFLVLGVYVEVWGLDDPDYNTRRSEKLDFYFSRKNPLVEIEPSDFEGKARAIRAKVQEILNKAKGRQEKLSGTGLRETRDLRLDEYLIAETMARENGELTAIDHALDQAQQEVGRARAVLGETEDRRKALQEQRDNIIGRWLG